MQVCGGMGNYISFRNADDINYQLVIYALEVHSYHHIYIFTKSLHPLSTFAENTLYWVGI